MLLTDKWKYRLRLNITAESLKKRTTVSIVWRHVDNYKINNISLGYWKFILYDYQFKRIFGRTFKEKIFTFISLLSRSMKIFSQALTYLKRAMLQKHLINVQFSLIFYRKF